MLDNQAQLTRTEYTNQLNSKQPHYIQQYVERPEFKSAIWAVPSQAESKTSTGQFVVVVKVNEDEGADTHVVNYKREPERFLTYAKRYNDLSYNRPIPAPNSNGALAEPLSKVQCYEMSSTGELVDVSSKVVLRALTFLPYIKSGYKDRESVEMPKTDGMPSKYGPRDYLVNKTLSSLTEEDLTLLDYQSLVREEFADQGRDKRERENARNHSKIRRDLII